jgi:DNA-binding NarL/FixJ family response regulator
VALAGSLPPDVVLMDLRMPSEDGFQATARIVRDHPEVRVVVLSAYETEESAEAVLAAGAFAFLPKHCGADRIRDSVVVAWRSRQAPSPAPSDRRPSPAPSGPWGP